MKHALRKIQEFYTQYPAKPGPSIRLQEWLDADEEDRVLEDHVDDNKLIFRD